MFLLARLGANSCKPEMMMLKLSYLASSRISFLASYAESRQRGRLTTAQTKLVRASKNKIKKKGVLSESKVHLCCTGGEHRHGRTRVALIFIQRQAAAVSHQLHAPFNASPPVQWERSICRHAAKEDCSMS